MSTDHLHDDVFADDTCAASSAGSSSAAQPSVTLPTAAAAQTRPSQWPNKHRRVLSLGDAQYMAQAHFSLGPAAVGEIDQTAPAGHSTSLTPRHGAITRLPPTRVPNPVVTPLQTHSHSHQTHRRQRSAVTYHQAALHGRPCNVLPLRPMDTAAVVAPKGSPHTWTTTSTTVDTATTADHQQQQLPTVASAASGVSGPAETDDASTSEDSSNRTLDSTKQSNLLRRLLTCQCFSCCPFAQRKQISEFRTVIPNHSVDDDAPPSLHPNAKFADNKIKTTKYSILTFLPKNLFEQFHRFANIYFVFIVMLNWMPGIEAFGRALSVIPILFVLSVTALKDIFEDYRRYRSDRKINNSVCRVWNYDDKRYARARWRDLRVGDFVHVGCNEIIPADILLLRSSDPMGICYVETSNLDGESNLKQRQSINSMLDMDVSNFVPTDFTSHVHCEHPNNQIYRFNGFILHADSREPVNKSNLLLRGCEVRNTDFVEGIVVYAGRETKAMLNNSGPRYKRSELERLMNWDIVWCVVLLLVMCLTGAAGSTIWLNSYGSAFNDKVPFLTYVPNKEDAVAGYVFNSPDFEGFLNFWTYVIVLQVMIPISLYVTIEVVKLLQIFFIGQDAELYHAGTDKRIQCRALNIPEELGQIQYVLSDKTGTLTENLMIFRRCAVSGVDYGPPPGGHGTAKTGDELNESIGSSDNVWDVTPNPDLLKTIYNASMDHFNVTNRDDTHQLSPTVRQEEGAHAFEFMLNMAICNTVVVNSRHHHDNMNASGYIMPSTSMLSKANVTAQSTQPGVLEGSAVRNNLSSRLPTLAELPTPASPDQPPNNGGESARANGVLSMVPPLQVTSASPPTTPPPPDPAPSDPHESTTRSNASTNMHTSRTFPSLLRPNVLSLKNFSSGLSNSLSPILKGKKNASNRADSPAPPLNPIYEAESPDELSLVHAAAAYNMRLLNRQINKALVELPSGARISYEILHTLPFDSDRKCMSVIVRTPHTHRPVLYVKGADVSITQLLSDEFVKSPAGSAMLYKSQQYLSRYSSYGLRTLCLAKRELDEAEYNEWAVQQREAEADIDNREQLIYESALRIERDLELLGVTGIEDRLQDGVPECIAALRHAGIKVWVLTGDKIETAVNIAYASRLFSPGMELLQLKADSLDATSDLLDIHVTRLAQRTLAAHSRAGSTLEATAHSRRGSNASPNMQRSNSCSRSHRRSEKIGLVVDGRTLAFCLQPELEERFTQIVARCTSVLCCRSTPLQKASVVRLAKEKLKGKTLAIGDGANDVSMIQCADVGVGISGQEGMQAVMASDFALARFRFLKRLLLVHGHWCYDRLARTVLYFFYKNALFVFTIFWFQLFCGFSGQVMIDQIYLMFYNLLFTSVPPVLLGIFDQSAPDHMLMAQPKLYAYGRYGLGYRWHSFWINMLDALWQSIAVYFTAHFTFYMSDIDLWSFGFLVTTALVIINQLHLAIEVQSWTLPLLASIVFSVALFFAFAFVYHQMVEPSWGVPDLPVRVDVHAMADCRFWLCILLIIVLGLLPRLTVLTLANMNRLVTGSSNDVLYARYSNRQQQQPPSSTKPSAWKVWWNKDKAVRIMPDSVLTNTAAQQPEQSQTIAIQA